MNNKIIELYESGKSSYEVSKLTGVSATQVRRILNKYSVKMKDNKTPDKIEDQIIERYTNGESSEKISADLGINGTTVCRILKRRGIDLRSPSQRHRILPLFEDYLDNMDTEEKAYFLGFMYADGNVSSSMGAFSLTLHNKDIEILQRFSNLFYGEDRTVSRKEPYVTLSIYSLHMKEKLISYGCMPNKTFKTKMPTFLRQDLVRHFIRGLYDGDGCISTSSNMIRVILTGSLTFLEEVKDAILSYKPSIQPIIRLTKHKTNVADMVMGKQADCVDFLNWIYQDATIYLSRKYISYHSVLELCKPPKNYGSTNIVSYNGQKLTSEFVSSIPVAERENIAQYLLSYFRRQGFPYQTFYKVEMEEDFNKLCNLEIKIESEIKTLPECGLKAFKHFCPHFHEVKNNKMLSMVEVFNDDGLLMDVIRNRLGITYKETFNITGNMIRQGIRNSRSGFAASLFKPSLAKGVYDKFVPDNGVVLDISAGFGQRMLGAMASKKVSKYIGIDPWDKQIEALSKIKEFFNSDKVELHCAGSENFYLPENSIDFCFSSPPFFDKEIYTGDVNQACHNRSFSEFIEDWWVPTATMVYKSLKPNSLFVLNMNLSMAKIMIERVEKLFKEIDQFYISYLRNYISSEGKDTFFVLKKI